MSNDFETHPIGTANKLKELTELVDKGSFVMTQMKGINDSNVATIQRQNVTISNLVQTKNKAIELMKKLIEDAPSNSKSIFKAKLFIQENL
jgi:hypothetical protein